VGPSAGLVVFPAVGDLVLVAYADGEFDQAFVIRRLSSAEDKLPQQAIAGDTVAVALAGKKVWVSSNTRINLSKSATQPTENLVLGQQLKTLLSAMLGELADLAQQVADLADGVSSHTHSGNLGFPTSPPTVTTAFDGASAGASEIKGALDNLKSSPVEDDGILSDLAFTEK
jgi:hypothetical protein